MARNKLYVGNLAYTVTREQLRELFSNYGEVMDVKVIENRGFGFVEMAGESEADKAKDALNGTEYEGRTLKVDEARERQPRRGGGGGPRDSWRGGGPGGGGGRGGRGGFGRY